LPEGERQDTRKHTRHVLRPDALAVERFLSDPSEHGFEQFRAAYLALLAQRLAARRAPFDSLAELARNKDVYLGCNCPTAKQPWVQRCHTHLALGFLAEQYPDLDVRRP
jgi:hypothetical protein